MNLLCIYANEPQNQLRLQFRCRNLADALNRTPPHRAALLPLHSFLQHTPQAQDLCQQADALLLYRQACANVLPAIEYWKARDKKIIIDFDEAPHYLDPTDPDFAFWNETPASASLPPLREQFPWGIALADAVTVPTHRLASDWAHKAPVWVIPDYLNTCQYPRPSRPHPPEIWLGLGSNHLRPFTLQHSGIIPALQHLCRQRPQVRVVCANPALLPLLGLPPGQVKVFLPQTFEDWVNILLQLDVGLAPLAGDYDNRQSPINLLEFMFAKIPWVASQPPLSHALQPYGVWVANNPQGWQAALQDLLQNLPAHRKKAAQEPFLHALGQDIAANLEKTLRLYAQILSQGTGAP